MRTTPSVVVIASLFLTTAAYAGKRGGSGGEGGRLGQVSRGIGKATSGGGGGGNGGRQVSYDEQYRDDELYRRERRGAYIVVVARDGTIVRTIAPRPEPSGGSAKVDVFLGVQKVHESNGSASASVAIEDRWFRIAGAITHYREDQMEGSRLTMTMPSAMLGVRLDDRTSRTRAFLEGGAAYVKTRNDPDGDSSLTGPILGMHVEHQLGRPALIADAHAMFFQANIRAYGARLGVRIGHFEAALRVLDFNVGPPLYGPEIGLQF